MSGRPPAPDGTEGHPVGRQGGLGPFVTFVEYERPDGLVARWDSRRQRKRAHGGSQDGGTWWAPGARGWWIGILFAVGSALFALGAVPGYAGAVGVRTDSITFFIGSLFFTTAAFLQYRESVDAGATPADGAGTGRAQGRSRFFVFRPRQIDWWASGIQLVGTLYFNVSTANAVRIDLSAQAAQQHVWRPDAVGSVCFLVASGMAWFEVCHGWTAWSPADISWWITGLNMVGSIAFGVSAVAAFIVPSTGQVWHEELSNLGTFVGALCFLAGAVLLLPERTGGPEPPGPGPAG